MLLRSRSLLLLLWGLVLCACGAPPLPIVSHPAPEPVSTTPPAEPPPLAVAGEPAPGAAPAAAAFPVFTDPGELPHLKVAGEGGQELPLEHTHVKARLTGFVADVEVSQTYQNPSTSPIEAQYVFPLPENSAVFHMRMVVGERVIEAVVQERAQARQTYEQAKRQGYTAALLEQERPNVFTQSVANIEPGKKIDVVIRYMQDLTYDAGQYEFVFPMVVGPRFVQGEPLGGPPSGGGTQPDTNLVPDASRVSPPILGRGERSGHDISIEVVASAGMAVSDFEVPTHEVVSRRPSDGTLRLTLAEKKSLPNRDFVLRYRAAGDKPRATLLTSGRGDGFFSLVLHPPALDVDDLVGRREIVFVVDVSGSMKGKPLAMCKEAMRGAISQLRPVDTFNVITFAGSTGKAFERPRPANHESVRAALAYVDAARAGGGTRMLDAITAALTPDVAQGRHRYVFFLTDGYVAMEDRILAATRTFVSEIEAAGRRAKVFGYGVGSSVNRNLIEGIAREGKGLAVYATNREDPLRAVNQFYRYIDRSVLRDVTIDWGDVTVSDVFPREIPDLFASRALVLHGRYKGAAKKPIVVRAQYAQGPIDVPVAVEAAPADDPREVLGTLWARAKVGWLEGALWDDASRAAAQSEITKLGIDHHLVTRFTSLVAVDRSKQVGPGDPTKIMQPVELPEAVDESMRGEPQIQARARVLASDTPAGMGPPPMAPPSPSDEPAGAEEMEVRGRRGCGCRLPDATGGDARWGLLAAAIALGVVSARRARRRRDP